MHPQRDNFIATMSDVERSASDAHAAWLRTLLADGVLIVAGPCLDQVNTGIAIFEAPEISRVHRTAQVMADGTGLPRGRLAG